MSEAARRNLGLRMGINVAAGQVTHAAVAEGVGMDYVPPEAALGFDPGERTAGQRPPTAPARHGWLDRRRPPAGWLRSSFETTLPPPWGPLELTPREAFLGPQEVVPLAAAEGRIAAESLAAYPPGVPNVLPGERLTGPTLEYIADTVASGGQVRGASDRTLTTVRVATEQGTP